MTNSDIAHRRLLNQHIARARFEKSAEVVAWLGAVQAQDYAGAKWALGLRLRGDTNNDIEQAFAEGSILRTHLLRPTWHFVTPADIRWMLTLTAPRVHAANAYMYRKLALDNSVFKRSNSALARALQGGQHLTRDELRSVLKKAGIATDVEMRMGYLMMSAELDGIVCSGPRRGNQFTYALLEERAPRAKVLDRSHALTELALRYFTSRGPATVQDFAKWSGLTITDCKTAIELVKGQLCYEVIDGQCYWFSTASLSLRGGKSAAYLLSIYDEYISGYKDRSAIVDVGGAAKLIALGNALTYVIVLDGQIVGTWKRDIDKDTVIVRTNTFSRLTRAESQSIAKAAYGYGQFLGKWVKVIPQ